MYQNHSLHGPSSTAKSPTAGYDSQRKNERIHFDVIQRPTTRVDHRFMPNYRQSSGSTSTWTSRFSSEGDYVSETSTISNDNDQGVGRTVWQFLRFAGEKIEMLTLLYEQERRARVQKKNIKNNLVHHDRFTRREAKVVICGTSNAGKSTVAKYLRIFHGGSYSATEREYFKRIIFFDSIDALIIVIGLIRRMNLHLSPDSDNNAYISITKNGSDAMLGFSEDPQVKQVISQLRRSDFNGSGLYFLRSIARITSPEYVPTDEDILHCHTETRQITETQVSMGSLIYKLVDTPTCPGGSDTRANWQSSFEGVTVLILVFALSDYDRMRDDDISVNRLVEAFTLFESICSSLSVKNSSIILFLNKMDLFREKLLHSRLDAHFPEYTGGKDVVEAAKYIQWRFMQGKKPMLRSLLSSYNPNRRLSDITNGFCNIERGDPYAGFA